MIFNPIRTPDYSFWWQVPYPFHHIYQLYIWVCRQICFLSLFWPVFALHLQTIPSEYSSIRDKRKEVVRTINVSWWSLHYLKIGIIWQGIDHIAFKIKTMHSGRLVDWLPGEIISFFQNNCIFVSPVGEILNYNCKFEDKENAVFELNLNLPFFLFLILWISFIFTLNFLHHF